MQSKDSALGMEVKVNSVITDLLTENETMPLFDSRPVLWKNLSALMIQKYGKENLNQLARDAKLGPATVSRIKAQETSVGLEVIDRVASVLGAHPWQLVHEGFDPDAPDKAPVSAEALDIAEMLDAIKDPERRRIAYAITTNTLTQFLNAEQPPA